MTILPRYCCVLGTTLLVPSTDTRALFTTSQNKQLLLARSNPTGSSLLEPSRQVLRISLEAWLYQAGLWGRWLAPNSLIVLQSLGVGLEPRGSRLILRSTCRAINITSSMNRKIGQLNSTPIKVYRSFLVCQLLCQAPYPVLLRSLEIEHTQVRFQALSFQAELGIQ